MGVERTSGGQSVLVQWRTFGELIVVKNSVDIVVIK